MIKLQHVSKTYQTKGGDFVALTDINLNVAHGEIFGVIGKSGAGKSTLIRCVNLLERPTSGTVIVDGKELTQLNPQQLREARHNIGMIFQHFNLLNTRTVFDNIALPLELLHKSQHEIRSTVQRLIELTGLEDRRNAYPSQLSGGQKQRVAIARALATQPKVLLCDEMTSALDPETTRSILQLLKEINAEFNLSILLITHEMEVIKSIADRVAVIDQGQIIENVDVETLFKKPQTPMARNLVHATLAPNLPKRMLNVMRSNPVENGFALVQILFAGSTAGEPIINDLIRQNPAISVDILQANLEYLRHETIGMMVLSLDGTSEAMQQALAFLRGKDLTVEVLGYVAADDWTIN